MPRPSSAYPSCPGGDNVSYVLNSKALSWEAWSWPSSEDQRKLAFIKRVNHVIWYKFCCTSLQFFSRKVATSNRMCKPAISVRFQRDIAISFQRNSENLHALQICIFWCTVGSRRWVSYLHNRASFSPYAYKLAFRNRPSFFPKKNLFVNFAKQTEEIFFREETKTEKFPGETLP